MEDGICSADTQVMEYAGDEQCVESSQLVCEAWDTAEQKTANEPSEPELMSEEPEYLQSNADDLYGNTSLAYEGNSANLVSNKGDLEPLEYIVEKGDTLTSIAKDHLGSPTDRFRVNEHIGNIAEENGINDLNLILPGTKLNLPGYTADGGYVTKDAAGDKTTIWGDGTQRIERQDGTGEVLKADGTAKLWGPKDQDNFLTTRDGGIQTIDAAGNKRTAWLDYTERLDNIDGTGYMRKPGVDKLGLPDGSYKEHHWGPEAKDNYDLERSKEGDYKRTDRTDGVESHEDLITEKARLRERAKDSFDANQYAQAEKYMNAFEKRAPEDKLSDKDIARTYHHVSRILENQTCFALTEKEHKKAALGILENASDPTKIDQGGHSTCNVTTIESRLYTRRPEDAARLVADVALRGNYTSGDGTTVLIPRQSLQPDFEAKSDVSIDGQRNYASQLFQVTAVNVYYAHEDINLRYEQHDRDPNIPGDSGERLMDYTSPDYPKIADGNNIVRRVFFGSDPLRSPGMDAGAIAKTINHITGLNETDAVIRNDDWGPNFGDIFLVGTEEEFKNKLKEHKEQDKFPTILSLDAMNEPFHQGGDLSEGRRGHVVTIRDYDPDSELVAVDNQWGTNSDLLGSNRISAHDLYIALGEADAESTISLLEEDVEKSFEQGNPNLYKNLELIRLQRRDGDIDDKEYDQKIIDIKRMADKRWIDQQKTGQPDQQERNNFLNKYRAMVNYIQSQDSGRARLIRINAGR
jgi:hypothetical protein